MNLLNLVFATAALALPSLGDADRNPDGSFRFVTQETAAATCGSRGARLPSARDYALFAITKGAKGIRETKYRDVSFRDPEVEAEASRNSALGYEPIYRFGPDLSWVIDFYYSAHGYRGPSNDLAVLSFWTSSDYPGNPPRVSSYVFGAETGRIDVNFRTVENGFGCLP